MNPQAFPRGGRWPRRAGCGGALAAAARVWVISASPPLISQRAGPLTASPSGEAQTAKKGASLPWPPLRGGSARRRWGRELYGCPKYFGLWQGSLPPPLRGTSLAEGGFSTRWRASSARPYDALFRQAAGACGLGGRRGGFYIRPYPFAAALTFAGAYGMRPYGILLSGAQRRGPPHLLFIISYFLFASRPFSGQPAVLVICIV